MIKTVACKFPTKSELSTSACTSVMVAILVLLQCALRPTLKLCNNFNSKGVELSHVSKFYLARSFWDPATWNCSEVEEQALCLKRPKPWGPCLSFDIYRLVFPEQLCFPRILERSKLCIKNPQLPLCCQVLNKKILVRNIAIILEKTSYIPDRRY